MPEPIGQELRRQAARRIARYGELKTMKTFIKNFIADESGASAAEYALIIAIVGVGIGAAALILGNNVTTAVGNAANEVNSCNTSSSSASVWSAGATC